MTDSKQNRTEIKIVIILILAVILIITFGITFTIWANKVVKYNSLDDYGCENINIAISYGSCLNKQDTRIQLFNFCYTPTELFAYYKLKCEK